MSKKEWDSTTELIDASIQVLEVEHPVTIRQLFYRLVSVMSIANCLRDYRRVLKVMMTARQDERVPYEWIVDRSRASYHTPGWGSLAELESSFDYQLRHYRRDFWQGKSVKVFYLGDHDPSGRDIERDLEERILRHLDDDELAEKLTFERSRDLEQSRLFDSTACNSWEWPV